MEDRDNTHARTHTRAHAHTQGSERNDSRKKLTHPDSRRNENKQKTGINHLREITVTKLTALALPGVGQDVGERNCPTLLVRMQTGPTPPESGLAIRGWDPLTQPISLTEMHG